jgi:glycosyltransferase involved in cell wall biosynthesis
LDDRAIKFSGIGIYTRNLAEIFSKLGHDVFLYDDNLVVSRSKFVFKYINFIRRTIKENKDLCNWLQENEINIYHVPKNTGVPFFSPKPVVVTIHDVIPHVFPQKYLNNILERIYYEVAIRISIKRSEKIITISEFSKQELIKYYGVNPEKITITLLAYNRAFRKIHDTALLKPVREKYNLHEKYLLAIGGSEYRKNMQRLINVYQKHFSGAYKLVVIGGKWRDVDLPGKYASDKNIRFLTNIPEEDLIAIYNMAEVFVFPSFYEGFGIPVLEGMACGVPVVTSNVSSMPEVGGDAAIYFDPYNEEDMAEKISRVLDDETLRKTMIAKGLEKVKEYSWKKCAEETLQVYKEVLESK